MKIIIDIPDAEIKQSYSTLVLLADAEKIDIDNSNAALKAALEQGEITLDISELEPSDQKKLKMAVGMMALGQMLGGKVKL